MSRIAKLAFPFLTAVAALFVSTPAFAAEGGGGGPIVALSAGLAIGLAVIGGALGQGRAAASALEGISRNPQASGKIFTPMIIALALTESLVLLAFLIANGLSGKV